MKTLTQKEKDTIVEKHLAAAEKRKTYHKIKNTRDRLLLVKAKAAGITVSDDEITKAMA